MKKNDIPSLLRRMKEQARSVLRVYQSPEWKAAQEELIQAALRIEEATEEMPLAELYRRFAALIHSGKKNGLLFAQLMKTPQLPQKNLS